MASRAEAPGRTLTGREAELAAVREVLDRAADGQSETLLVFGEAGVGKTALIQHAAAGARPPTLVLSGVCLPLQSISVPLLPLRAASRGLTGRQLPHPWPLDGLDDIEQAPALLDAWLQEVASAAPVVLQVDDLQWADESTLDVLMYLVAGPPDRRFLLATVRSQSVPDGHPFHRWLADALRLPRVSNLDLQPLDRADTEAQVASLLGTVPHQTLVDDVFAHTLGNPYLNLLVTADLEPTARRLPDDLPADLRVAVRRTWHGLSPLARDITSESGYRAATAGLSWSSGVLPDLCEFLVPLAARALADRAEAARDAGMTDSAVVAELRALTERFPDVVTDPGQPTPLMIVQRSAMLAWYAAEIGRARQSAGSGERWLKTAALFEKGGLPWLEVYAWRRAAAALLGGGRQTRAEGRRALVRGYELACELQAAAVQRELEALARSARVPLGSGPKATVAPSTLPGLTAREHEILGYLVAGSTYAEIAKSLVISEKTVSSHVSNLLRKTHTSSRVELAQLAHRIEQIEPST
jgi:DNA-binding CsgD family transcriptional regulator